MTQPHDSSIAADSGGDADKVRSLFHSLVTDFVLFLPDVVAAVLANSIILLADVLKCACELLATLLAWLALRRISRGESAEYEYGVGKLENLTSIIVGAVMSVCFAIVVFTAVYRMLHPSPIHSGGAGLAVFLMLCGMCANTWLWIKNYRIAKLEHSPIMESQWRLFRTKAMADSLVFASLILSLGLGRYAWSVYIDPAASFVIAAILLFSIHAVITHSVYDLLDKTLDEGVQLIIINKLVAFFHEYKELHGVRSRRSGGDIFIEIFLEFDGARSMAEVQKVINDMKGTIEKSIRGSSVSIIPTTTNVTD
ncbi:MAG: cation diffusion facilitator family transporter [Elusimicrobia bacterium]|nr:cation diffusion facilitator family transporter [Elusimicrobiota bacterium]